MSADQKTRANPDAPADAVAGAGLILLPEGSTSGPRDLEATPFWDGDLPAHTSSHGGLREHGIVRLGRYEVGTPLGHGGMGVVYRAWDPELGREVAIKLVGARFPHSQESRRRLLREARAVAGLDHPGIIRVYDIGEHEGQPFFVMERIHGPSLADRLTFGPVEPMEAARFASALARALHAAHVQGLIHRDVKPSNVLLRDGVEPVLTDFGLVKVLDDDRSQLTVGPHAVGTPAYMAPEQAGVGQVVDGRADQYALGAVLVAMLTGHPPSRLRAFDDGPGDGWEGGRRTDPAAPPVDLRRICQKATAEEPEDRYPDAAALADDLDRFLRGEVVLAPLPSLRRRMALAFKRHSRRLLPVVAALAAVALTLGLSRAWSAFEAHQRAEARELLAEEGRLRLEAQTAELTSRGKHDLAEKAFQQFVDLAETRGTHAWVLAHFAQAERLEKLNDTTRAAEALGTAWQGAEDPDDQYEALTRLARLFRRLWRWKELTWVVNALEAQTDLAPTAELRRLHADAALAARDLPTARHLLDDDPLEAPRIRLLDAFSTAMRTPLRLETRSARMLPLVEGRTPILAALDDGGRTLRLLCFKTVPPKDVAKLPFPPAFEPAESFVPLRRGPGQPADLVVWHRGRTAALYTLEEDRLVLLHHWTDDRVGDADTADLDGDGALEIYVGTKAYSRHLLALRRQPDGSWETRSPHPGTDLVSSDIYGVRAADFDQDGKTELLVSAGGWRAYDVRVLAHDRGGDLRLVSRLKLGSLEDVTLLPGQPPLILGVRVDGTPNLRVFPADRPSGEPPGVYAVGLRGGSLYIHGRTTVAPALALVNPVGGDLDGDGRADAALWSGRPDAPFTAIAMQRNDGTLTDFILGGLHPLAAFNMDDDAADELVVADTTDGHQLWLLGVGDTPLPKLQPLLPPADARSPRDPAIAAAWRRAQELMILGLAAPAAAALDVLADRAAYPDDAILALRQGAELLEATGHTLEAAHAYERLAAHDTQSPQTWLAEAADLYLSHNQLSQALQVITRLLTTAPVEPAEAARWAARERQLREAQRQQVTLDLSRPLDHRWQVKIPGSLQWRPSREGLTVDHVMQVDQAQIARLPLQWDGERFTLEADLRLDLLEWAGGLEISLEGPDGQVVGFGVYGSGGNTAFHHDVNCVANNFSDGLSFPVNNPDVGRRVSIRLELRRDAPLARCTIQGDGVSVPAAFLFPPSRHGGDGPWALTLSGFPRTWAGYSRSTVGITRLKIQGATLLDGEPTTPEEEMGLNLANNRPEAVLAQLGPGPDTSLRRQLLRYFANDALSRVEAADAALQVLLADAAEEDPARWAALMTLMRRAPERLQPLLAEGAGPERALQAFHDSWHTVAWSHPGWERVYRTLTLTLPRGPDDAWSPPARHALSDLLLSRARGAQVAGAGTSARQDLTRALELTRLNLQEIPEGATGFIDGRADLSQLHVQLAHELAVAEESAAATAHVRDALDVSPFPELTADVLTADPLLSPLFYALQSGDPPGRR